jgi:hypothetical protein
MGANITQRVCKHLQVSDRIPKIAKLPAPSRHRSPTRSQTVCVAADTVPSPFLDSRKWRACADAQGRDNDCAVGPPAAAAAAPISASAAEPVWPWLISVLDMCSASPPRPCVHIQAAPSCGT